MIDLGSISTNLEKDCRGIWVSPESGEVSYPEEGNEACYQVEESSFWFLHRNKVIADAVARFAPDQTFFDYSMFWYTLSLIGLATATFFYFSFKEQTR